MSHSHRPGQPPRLPLPHALLAGTALCLLLAACGGGGSDSAAGNNDDDAGGGPPPVVAPPIDPVAACAALNGFTLAAADLSLPTTGASVTAATYLTGGTLGNHCQVRGAIRPVDPSAPDIGFAVNLPTDWNGKAIHFGGGGFNGRLIDGTEQIRFGPPDKPAPLALGYATFGDDSGHQSSSITDGSFAANDEALANYGGLALKKTHDVAMKLVRARYGSAPTQAYFLGTSTGGRDALAHIQRWPADYHGVIANEPALNYSGTRLSNLAVGRALYLNGGAGWLNVAKTLLVQRTAMTACDTLDGAADGIVSNVESCRLLNAQVLNALRCPGGVDTGNTCLSDAQLDTVRAIESPLDFTTYTLAHGVTRAGGYNLLEGALVAGPYTSRDLGTRAVPGNPATSADANMYVTGDQWAKYFVTRVASFDSLGFDPLNPGLYTARVQAASAQTDATNPDLSAFLARGGRLIMLHGLADEVISPNSTIDYHQRVLATVGQAAADAGIRFYTVPGMGHGTGVFIPNWDSLAALENWVERGLAPATVTAFDAVAGTYGRTRPLCEYPAYPKYRGSGSLDAAVNFSCVTEVGDPLACSHLPSALTSYKGGNTRGEELTLQVDPATLAYTLTIDASLQRAPGTQRSGTLIAQGQCSYASAENGALFTFSAGGLVHGGIAAASGGGHLPLLAFRDTFVNTTAGSGFNTIAGDFNAVGADYSAGGTLSTWAGTGKIRNAGTWQTCQATGTPPGFMLYEANCSPATKGYLQYSAVRNAYELMLTSTCGGAGCPSTPTSGGTVTGSVVAGLVGGSPVPLVLLRAADASSSGMRLYARQATLLPGTGDGRYAMNSTDGSAVGDATVLGTALTRGAQSDVLDFDTPVAGVTQTRAAPPAHLLFSNGVLGQLETTRLLLGVRH
ncbi:tannase/feruloyl esterase family alpha/beta hydrolase [Hydrogenophaga sp. ANAO-22]|uniref:tannase/feruloyl esterase family alpha/beta hydrolase n=1 Tax=Hydrogenophaga sp. ANAO-22 TaxID=3166645 RepID=UPI0036D3965B